MGCVSPKDEILPDIISRIKRSNGKDQDGFEICLARIAAQAENIAKFEIENATKDKGFCLFRFNTSL